MSTYYGTDGDDVSWWWS